MNALPYLFAGFSDATNVENNSHAASTMPEYPSSAAAHSGSDIVKKLGEVSPAVAKSCVLQKTNRLYICFQ